MAALCCGLLLLLVSACGGSPPPPSPGRDSVLDAFGVGPDGANSAGTAPRLPVRVYIDNSGSMKGFVKNRSFTYARLLSDLMGKAATADYEVETFKFSDDINPVIDNPSEAMLYPGFYQGSTTKLGRILSRVAEEKLGEHVTVVISDFVHSAGGEDYLELVSAFRNLVEVSPAAVLLAFRSGFDGSYWPSAHPRSTNDPYPLNLGEDRLTVGRPFYVLALAPTKAALRSFKDYVLNDLNPQHTFEPDRPPTSFKEVSFAPDYRQGSTWNRYSKFHIESQADRIRRLVAFFVEREAPRGEGELRLKFEVETETPIKSYEKIAVDAWRVRFRGRKAQGEPERVQLEPRIRFEPSRKPGDSDAIFIGYPLSRPQEPGSWEAYRIQLRGGEGNIEAPFWVEAWTTKDDRAPVNGNQTLNFDLLVEAMVRSLTERVVFCDQFIVIGRGD